MPTGMASIEPLFASVDGYFSIVSSLRNGSKITGLNAFIRRKRKTVDLPSGNLPDSDRKRQNDMQAVRR